MHQLLKLDGNEYVIVPREEFQRLTELARAADLPDLPRPDGDGNYPAVDYAKASLSRRMIRERAAVGITQRELGKRSGVSFETICRLERGHHIPSVRTIAKLDQALKQAAHDASANGGSKRTTRRTRKTGSQ